MDFKVKPNASGAAKIPQLRYNEQSKSDKVLQVLAVPKQVIADASGAGILVGKGSLLRVKGTASQYISFGADAAMAAPTVASNDAVEAPADFFYIVATDNFVRTSAAMRIEVVED